MSYLGLETVKPIKPMKRGDLYSFPITTIDQIVTDEKTNERLPEYLDKNFGMDLLWTNASPTSAFAAQSINLSNAYTHYAIFSDDLCSNNITILPLGGQGDMLGFYTEGSYKIIQRNVRIDTNGVLRFFDCNRRETYGSGGTLTNNHLVPTAVYGFNL